ncbi:MAG: hypothetical protein ACR2NA_00030, partial [Solirubrobacterales bacterium]
RRALLRHSARGLVVVLALDTAVTATAELRPRHPSRVSSQWWTVRAQRRPSFSGLRTGDADGHEQSRRAEPASPHSYM